MRDEDLPQTAVEAPAHLTAPAVPSIELADDGNARRIGRPHRKQHAVDAFVTDELGAKPAVELAMRTLSRQIVVERAQRRPERVRVDVRIGAMRGCDFDAIGGALSGRRDQRLEKVAPAARQLGHERAVAGERAHGDRLRRKDPDDPSRGSPMRPEHGERIGIARGRDRVEFLGRALSIPPP